MSALLLGMVGMLAIGFAFAAGVGLCKARQAVSRRKGIADWLEEHGCYLCQERHHEIERENPFGVS